MRNLAALTTCLNRTYWQLITCGDSSRLPRVADLIDSGSPQDGTRTFCRISRTVSAVASVLPAKPPALAISR